MSVHPINLINLEEQNNTTTLYKSGENLQNIHKYNNDISNNSNQPLNNSCNNMDK